MNHPKLSLLLISAIAFPVIASSQNLSVGSPEQLETTAPMKKKQLNFFIISKRKIGAIDLATRFNVIRTKMKSALRRKKFVSIIARNTVEAGAKIELRLKKYGARIGTIWFDSHGMYKRGYSLFFVGSDEVSFRTIDTPSIRRPLEDLTPYADDESRIVVGSCYGGATYTRSSIDYKDTTRMNGDSLMISLGRIFCKSSIYASESWVMTKPGLFLKRASVAGFPGRKLFRDSCYKPAWENVGVWNEYKASTHTLTRINPVTLNMYGSLLIRSGPYPIRESERRAVEKKKNRLKANLYK